MSTKTVPFNYGGQLVTPVSGSCAWLTVMSSGLDAADSSAATAAFTHGATVEASSTRHIFKRDYKAGTRIWARVKYAGTITTDPVLVLFGRMTGYTEWQRLTNLAGAYEVTISEDSTNDITDGTSKWTSPDTTNHVWDTAGCDEFFFAVKTAAVGTAAAAASLEVKVV